MFFPVIKILILPFLQDTDDGVESCLESSQDAYEGNKDAARAILRVKQKLDGYEEGEMRSVQGQVILKQLSYHSLQL